MTNIPTMNLTIFSQRVLVMFSLFTSTCLCLAGQFTTLYTFQGPEGSSPRGPLVQDADGNFWGTAGEGGLPTNISQVGPYWPGCGAIFKMTPSGALSSFPLDCTSISASNGWSVVPGLVLAKDGNFYASAEFGPRLPDSGGTGLGAIIQTTLSGNITTIHSFTGPDGNHPLWLVQGPDESLYGVTLYGGAGNYGSVFRITTNGMLATLAYFNGTNGSWPSSSIILGQDNNFYGMTESGGENFGTPNPSRGTIYRMTTNGVLTSLISFNGTNGYYPVTLLQTTDGSLYGTTFWGGPAYNRPANFGYGTVFHFSTNGELTTLYSFTGGSDGARPNYLTHATDGNFYGLTTSGGGVPPQTGIGTLFKLTPEGNLTTLHVFSGGADGAYPTGLMQARDGNLYGTTDALVDIRGGPQGTIFRYVLHPEPRFESASCTNDTFAFSWSVEVGSSYQVQFSTNPSSTNWNNLGSPIICTNSPMSGFDAIGTNSQRFYRVVMLP